MGFHYVQQPALLAKIEDGFSHATEHSPHPKIVVLLGMSGLGKTQLALDYCGRSRALYRAIFWINASSSNTVTRELANIAGEISEGRIFDNYDSMIDFVKATLSSWADPWLMVFDGYDDPKEFQDIPHSFPQGDAGAILITSRNSYSKRLGTTIQLTGMTENQSLELLLRRSDLERNPENIAQGMKIVRMFGYLPLAIDQAGAYINMTRLALSQYIELYENQKKAVLEHTPLMWEYGRQNIYST